MDFKNEKIKVEFKNVSKSFGDRHILKNFSLKIPEGKTVVILGGSGTGKSVSIKCLLGLLQPDSGDILVDGKSVIGLAEKDQYALMKKFGMLFQFGALFDSLSNWENVAFALLEQGVKPKKAKRIALEKLSLVGLGKHVGDLMPSEISGGMKKRVSLARAICTNPEIVLYDEPTTGLHFQDIELLLKVLHRLVDEGNTMVIIEHNLDVIKTSDYIIDIGPEGGQFGGEVIAKGTPEQVAKSTKSHTARYLKKVLDKKVLDKK